MKMEKCRHPRSLEYFRINKRTAQLKKYCVRCLDIFKKSRQQTKCKHGRQKPTCHNCGGSYICGSTTREDQDTFFVAEVKFVSTTRED